MPFALDNVGPYAVLENYFSAQHLKIRNFLMKKNIYIWISGFSPKLGRSSAGESTFPHDENPLGWISDDPLTGAGATLRGPPPPTSHSLVWLLKALQFASDIRDVHSALGDSADLTYVEVSRSVRLKDSQDDKVKETKEVLLNNMT